MNKPDEFEFRMKSRDGKPITSMDTTEDGRLILTGGNDGQVQLWDGIERELIGARFLGHDTKIQAVALAPDGRFFVTADASKILLWPGPKRWADIICRKLVWNMSRKQWREWVSENIIKYTKQCPGLPVSPDNAVSGAK